MEVADKLERALAAVKKAIAAHDLQELGSLSLEIVSTELENAGVDPAWVLPLEDSEVSAQEYVTYLVTKLLIRGHVEAGEIETVPEDFDLSSTEGAAAIQTLARRHEAERN